MHDRAVLGDHAVDEGQVARDPAQLGEDAAGHEQHEEPVGTGAGNRAADGHPHPAVVRGRAVVVERQHQEPHQDDRRVKASTGVSSVTTRTISQIRPASRL